MNILTKFRYIKKVIESCQTEEQNNAVYSWSSKLLAEDKELALEIYNIFIDNIIKFERNMK